MSKYFNGFSAFIIIACSSCGGSDSPEYDRSIVPDSVKTTNSSIQPIAAPQALPVPANVANLPAPAPEQVKQAVTIPAGEASKVVKSAGLNPAHGQPGHRCDIAVGAPLSSAPAATPQQPAVVQSTPVATQAVPAAAPTNVTAPGMNPPHGQPGHDCSIAVGAPLKKG